MGYTSLRLCSNSAAYEAIPRPRLRLDLRAIRARLERDGITVVDARVMLIARMAREVTIAHDGRVLIKSRDPDEAEGVFATLRTYLDIPEDGAAA